MSTLTPHGACLLWKPELIWLNAVSDAMLAGAFFATAFVLGFFVWRRRDVMFRGVFWGLAIFNTVCGVTPPAVDPHFVRAIEAALQNHDIRPSIDISVEGGMPPLPGTSILFGPTQAPKGFADRDDGDGE